MKDFPKPNLEDTDNYREAAALSQKLGAYAWQVSSQYKSLSALHSRVRVCSFRKNGWRLSLMGALRCVRSLPASAEDTLMVS